MLPSADGMLETVRIRPYRADDLPEIDALEARIQPYRPEDEAEVQAMFARALQAEQTSDGRWMTPPTLPSRPFSEEYDAFWVAEPETEIGADLVGIVGVQMFRAAEIIPADHPLAQEWRRRGGVAELRRLRVAPDARRRGLGRRLCEIVIEWSREHGVGTLIVNTTTPQLPALQLYRSLGFQDRGLSYIGRYELTWLEFAL